MDIYGRMILAFLIGAISGFITIFVQIFIMDKSYVDSWVVMGCCMYGSFTALVGGIVALTFSELMGFRFGEKIYYLSAVVSGVLTAIVVLYIMFP